MVHKACAEACAHQRTGAQCSFMCVQNLCMISIDTMHATIQ